LFLHHAQAIGIPRKNIHDRIKRSICRDMDENLLFIVVSANLPSSFLAVL
jgi:hypothetical protein